MKERFPLKMKFILTFIILLCFIFQFSYSQNSNNPRKIIRFKKNYTEHKDKENFLLKFKATELKYLPSINGMAANIPEVEEKELKKRISHEILRIDEDLELYILGNKHHQPPEITTNNMNIINVISLWARGIKGSTIKVAIMDTGIDLDHPDLAVNIKGGINILKHRKKDTNDYNGNGNSTSKKGANGGDNEQGENFDTNGNSTSKKGANGGDNEQGENFDTNGNSTSKKGANGGDRMRMGDDDNGHGTHVAGIVAAVDNEIGVIGVGPDIFLYPVKIINKKGKGYLSDLIDGIDWCIENEIQVINMSFGSLYDNDSFYEAILKAHDAGIVIVASAGNNGENGGAVVYPAAYPETIAVAAIDETGQFASFSSFGPEVDLMAPGENIFSTTTKDSYGFMSGTSVAAPHVTGVIALVLTTSPLNGYDLNGNGLWDPDEIKFKIKLLVNNIILTPAGPIGLVDALNVIDN